jgi:hypothetical protein
VSTTAKVCTSCGAAQSLAATAEAFAAPAEPSRVDAEDTSAPARRETPLASERDVTERTNNLSDDHSTAGRRRHRPRRLWMLAGIGIVALAVAAWLVVGSIRHNDAVNAFEQSLPAIKPCHEVGSNLPVDFRLHCDGGGGVEVYKAKSSGDLPALMRGVASGIPLQTCPSLTFTTWEVLASVNYGTVFCGPNFVLWCDQSAGYIGEMITVPDQLEAGGLEKGVSAWENLLANRVSQPGVALRPSAYDNPGACS